MKIQIKSIKRKKGYMIVVFENQTEEETKTYWTTIYLKKKKWYFNNCVYIINRKMNKIFDEIDGKKTTRKFIDPDFHFNAEKTEQIISMLFQSKEIQEIIQKEKIVFDLKKLFQKEDVKQREENLKLLIEIALERGESIGIIGPDAEFYVPFDQLYIGEVALDDAYESEYADEEEILEKIELFFDSYAVKLYSYYNLSVYKDKTEEEPELNFVWELSEECVFFDQIFFLDTISRLGRELLNQKPVIYSSVLDNAVMDEWDIVDLILYDEENIFSEITHTVRSEYKKILEEYDEDDL